MPTYNTQCNTCQATSECKLSFRDHDDVREGRKLLACSCGGELCIVFQPSDVSFVLKDGESGGWASKAGKEKSYRARHNQVMAKRERDHVRPTALTPNFGGQVAASWKDARDAAYQSTYAQVRSEHGPIDASKAASAAAQTYDPYVKREVS